ncbi:c-type cytochrome biogenesis protein CcmI [Gammaproteobacteria bacterium]|nr:c-type cytochrome biogenesis protein CcmI [Gammaproteobacteria bacterium]
MASALIALAIALLAPALLRRPPEPSHSRSSINIGIARERERELRRELQEDVLSEADYDQARAELEINLLGDLDQDQDPGSAVIRTPAPVTATLLAVLIPLAALGLYLFLGHPGALDPSPGLMAQQLTSAQPSTPDVDAMLSKLRERLLERPDDVRGWTLLANALMSTGRYPEAVTAYERLVQLEPRSPEFLVRLADALAMSNNGSLAGQATQLITEALALDPEQIQGLWLAGIAAEERGEPIQALDFWRRLEPLVVDQPELLSEVRVMIGRASTELQKNQAQMAEPLRIAVSITPDLLGSVTSEDTLFLYARVPDGPPMPVAARKLPALPLPRQIILDDRATVMTAGSLLDHRQLVVGAHISRSGNAMKSSGDLLGMTNPFDPAQTQELAVVVNKRIP